VDKDSSEEHPFIFQILGVKKDHLYINQQKN